MGSRWCLYGYKIKNNCYYIIEDEAEIVRYLFERYIYGISFIIIADKLTKLQVNYSEDKNIWNKNMISRIIMNKHYQGDEKYPKIISCDLYKEAENIRNSRGGQREKDSNEVQFVKNHIFCAECDSKIKRIGKYINKEKWFCSNNCKTNIYIDDDFINKAIREILNNVIENPELLLINKKCTYQYSPNSDVIKKENELAHLVESGSKNFKEMTDRVFSIITSRFDCFEEDLSGEYTNALIEYIKTINNVDCINYEIFKKLVTRIMVNQNGTIYMVFINGIKVSQEGSFLSA